MIFSENELYGTLNREVEKIPPKNQEKVAFADVEVVEVEPDTGYTGLSKVTINAVDNTIDDNIQSYNIKAGVTILGVEGNVEPDKPDQEKTVNPSTQRQEITADTGYELARVIINGVDNTIDQNITSNNIKKDVSILGVTGNVVELKGQTKTINPSTSSQTITPDTNYNGITEITVTPVTSDIDANITSGNIKSGISILGVSGSVVPLNAQSKTITPTKQEQTVSPDSNYNALSSVVVNSIPNEYIIPTGTKSITTNGTHDVSEYASASVNVEGDLSEYFDNTRVLSSYNAGQWLFLVKKLPSLTFTGTNASYLFYNFKGTTIPSLTFTDKITNASYMFYLSLVSEVPLFDTSEVTNVSYMLSAPNLTTVPLYDFSKVTNASYLFSNANMLTSIPQLDFSKATNVRNMFAQTRVTNIPLLDFGSANNIINLMYSRSGYWPTIGGFKDLGKAYLTTASANTFEYGLDLSSGNNTYITRENLMNIINNLYDIATAGVATQQLKLGNSNIGRLTADDIAIATGKGWSVV